MQCLSVTSRPARTADSSSYLEVDDDRTESVETAVTQEITFLMHEVGRVASCFLRASTPFDTQANELSLSLSMALQPVGPWPPFQSFNPIYSQ
jgi:hypothetical protein